MNVDTAKGEVDARELLCAFSGIYFKPLKI